MFIFLWFCKKPGEVLSNNSGLLFKIAKLRALCSVFTKLSYVGQVYVIESIRGKELVGLHHVGNAFD